MNRNKKKEDAAETVVVSSLSADVQKEKEVIINTTDDSQEANSNFYQDFFGFSSEEWSRKVSHKDSPLQQQQQQEQQPVCVRKQLVGKKGDKEITNPIFRSKSVSFKYMRFKIGSSSSTAMGTKRSKSVPALASNSRSKSRWQVFMSGFGSGRFPTKMDLVDIKSRQLRPNSKTNKVSTQDVVDHHVNTEAESGGGKTSGRNTVWWKLVDVLGCGGRYATDIKEVVV